MTFALLLALFLGAFSDNTTTTEPEAQVTTSARIGIRPPIITDDTGG